MDPVRRRFIARHEMELPFVGDVAFGEGAAAVDSIKMGSLEDETLGGRGDSLRLGDLGLELVDGRRGFDVDPERLAMRRVHHHTHRRRLIEGHQGELRAVDDVAVSQGVPGVIESLPAEDQDLFRGWNTEHGGDFVLEVLDRVLRFHLDAIRTAVRPRHLDVHREPEEEGRAVFDTVIAQLALGPNQLASLPK